MVSIWCADLFCKVIIIRSRSHMLHPKKMCPNEFLDDKNSSDFIRLLRTSLRIPRNYSDFLENSSDLFAPSDFHGLLWTSSRIPRLRNSSELHRLSREFLGLSRTPSNFDGISRISMHFLGLPWTSTDFLGLSRTSTGFLENSSDFHGLPYIPQELLGLPREFLGLPHQTNIKWLSNEIILL